MLAYFPTYDVFYALLPWLCMVMASVTGPGRQGDDPSLRPRPRAAPQRPRRQQRHGAEPAAGGGAQRGGGGDSHGAGMLASGKHTKD